MNLKTLLYGNMTLLVSMIVSIFLSDDDNTVYRHWDACTWSSCQSLSGFSTARVIFDGWLETLGLQYAFVLLVLPSDCTFSSPLHAQTRRVHLHFNSVWDAFVHEPKVFDSECYLH